VLDASGANLSAYTISANGVGAERMLETGGKARSFGIANDLKVYEFTTDTTLQFYDPFAAAPVLTPVVVSATVSQWQLGPNGQVAFRTAAGSFTVGTRTVTGVAQLGFAPNGQLYYLTTSGSLVQGVGRVTTPGAYAFGRISTGVAAFAVNNNSALLMTRKNGA